MDGICRGHADIQTFCLQSEKIPVYDRISEQNSFVFKDAQKIGKPHAYLPSSQHISLT